ncbi:putative purine permease, plant [Rosa chinensis]|uniref:Putative purine permease, plant n=1 Tax=Rosa chinensis TaxID=74649 RepID=A0A2P6P9N9_ROSCH|nr:putative purine permease, plant [Rosa chinensis]
MDAMKVIAMLLAIWGFLSYIYQHYLDDLKSKENRMAIKFLGLPERIQKLISKMIFEINL